MIQHLFAKEFSGHLLRFSGVQLKLMKIEVTNNNYTCASNEVKMLYPLTVGTHSESTKTAA